MNKIKQVIPELILLTLSLTLATILLTSCASDGGFAGKDRPIDTVKTLEKATAWARITVSLAAADILDRAIGPEDLAKKKEVIRNASGVVGKSLSATPMSASEVEAALSPLFPEMKHWNTLAAAIGSASVQFREYVGNTGRAWLDFISAVSLGLWDASQL